MWAVERHVEKGAKLVVRRQELWLLSPHGVAPEVAGPKALAVKCPCSGALFFLTVLYGLSSLSPSPSPLFFLNVLYGISSLPGSNVYFRT